MNSRPVTVHLRTDSRAPELFAHKSQSGVQAEVVGRFFDKKVGHVSIHLLGDQNMRSKPLILIGKSTYFGFEVTDSGRSS